MPESEPVRGTRFVLSLEAEICETWDEHTDSTEYEIVLSAGGHEIVRWPTQDMWLFTEKPGQYREHVAQLLGQVFTNIAAIKERLKGLELRNGQENPHSE